MNLTEKLQLISDKIKSKDLDWFEEKRISVGQKSGYWILNYIQAAERNELNSVCRGLIFSEKGGLSSFPFARFFNLGEKEAEVIDFKNAQIIEKLDGSLSNVFFEDTKPIWHTRKMLSLYDSSFTMKSFRGSEFNLIEKIGEHVKQIDFPKGVRKYTLMFEYVDELTQVVTKYDKSQFGLYLIGARNLNTLEELSEDNLDLLATSLSVRRPRRWNFTSYDEITEMLSSMSDDFEGIVAREASKRIKIKKDSYVKLHHLLDKFNYDTVLDIWKSGEESEVTAYFPEFKEKLAKVEENYTKVLSDICEKVLYWDNRKLDRKELALRITGQKGNEAEPSSVIRSIIFKTHNNIKNITEQVGTILKGNSNDNLIDLLKLE